MRRAIEFLKNISNKVSIYIHDDTDGVCSGALLLALLNQKNIRPKLFCGDIEEETFRMHESKPKNIIFLDFAIDQYPEFLEKFKEKNVLIIDHHPIFNDLNKMGFIHINPRFKDPKKYVSAASICFKICRKAGLENFEWLKRLGNVGDHVISGNKQEREADEIICAVKAVKGSKALLKVTKVLSRIKKIEDFLYRGIYQKIKNEFEKEIEKQIKNFEKFEIKDVNFFELKSKYNILSYLAGVLLDIYPDKTIILYRHRDSVCNVSGRSKKYNLGEIFKKASEGIGRGGGHPIAAGARIRSSDINKFKKRVLKLIS